MKLRTKLTTIIAAFALALSLLGSAGCIQITGATNDQAAGPAASQNADRPASQGDAGQDVADSGAGDQNTPDPNADGQNNADSTGSSATTTEPSPSNGRHHNSSHDDHEGDHHLSFRNHHALEEHFEKHGAEVGCASVEDYLAAANAVIENPEALHKLQAEDGDDVYFLESTGEFVVVSPQGFIRTYFITDRDYFDRQ